MVIIYDIRGGSIPACRVPFFIREDNCLIHDMPILSDGTRNYVDVRALASLVQPVDPGLYVLLERSQPMPRDGSVGSFRYSESYGLLKATLIMAKIPFQEISAASWRPKIVGRRDKDRSHIVAGQFFLPCADQLSRKKDHGRAEALLLAEFARRTYTQGKKGVA